MGITREDLKRTGQWLNVSEKAWKEELKTREHVIFDRYMANDQWANKAFKKVGIMLTSHQSNRPYVKACLESHRKLGYWITVVYDNFIDPQEENVIDYNKFMLPPDLMKQIDTFIMTPYQTWGGVLYPYFWQLKLGVAAMKDFEYIYCTNSDFIMEKPENFDKLLEHMGNHDVLSYYSDNRSVGTCFIAKTSALVKIVQHIQDHFIPFEVYEKYTQEFGNAEGRFSRAIKDLGFSLAPVEQPFNEQMHKPGHGTWYDIVGYRHIHGEHNYAYRRRGIPPHYKYLDERFVGGEYQILKKYWDEGQDAKVLEQWWAKG